LHRSGLQRGKLFGGVLIWILLLLLVGVVAAKEFLYKPNVILRYGDSYFEIHYHWHAIGHNQEFTVRGSDLGANQTISKTSLMDFPPKTGMIANTADNIESYKGAGGCIALNRNRLSRYGRRYGANTQLPLRWMICGEQVKRSNLVSSEMIAKFPLGLGGIGGDRHASGGGDELGISLNAFCDGLADVLYRQFEGQSSLLAVNPDQTIYRCDINGKPRTFGNFGLLLNGDGRLKRSVGLVAGRSCLILKNCQLPFDSFGILNRVFSCQLDGFLGNVGRPFSLHGQPISGIGLFGGLVDEFIGFCERFSHLIGLGLRLLGLDFGRICLLPGSDSQVMGVYSAFVHLPELIFQNPYSKPTSSGQNERKHCHPDCSYSRAPCNPIRECLIFLLGCALVPLAFYIADEPTPPVLTRCLYWLVGGGAFLFICQGLYLIILAN